MNSEYKVYSINILSDMPESGSARAILDKLVLATSKILIKKKWKVKVLREFYPKNNSLLGLNVNRGSSISIRLREAANKKEFLPWHSLLGTMLHELCHNEIGQHSAEFYELIDKIYDDVDAVHQTGSMDDVLSNKRSVPDAYTFTGSFSVVGGALGKAKRQSASQMAGIAAAKRVAIAQNQQTTLGAMLGTSDAVKRLVLGSATRQPADATSNSRGSTTAVNSYNSCGGNYLNNEIVGRCGSVQGSLSWICSVCLEKNNPAIATTATTDISSSSSSSSSSFSSTSNPNRCSFCGYIKNVVTNIDLETELNSFLSSSHKRTGSEIPTTINSATEGRPSFSSVGICPTTNKKTNSLGSSSGSNGRRDTATTTSINSSSSSSIFKVAAVAAEVIDLCAEGSPPSFLIYKQQQTSGINSRCQYYPEINRQAADIENQNNNGIVPVQTEQDTIYGEAVGSCNGSFVAKAMMENNNTSELLLCNDVSEDSNNQRACGLRQSDAIENAIENHVCKKPKMMQSEVNTVGEFTFVTDWTCNLCTFQNNFVDRLCAMCESAADP